MVCLDDTHFFSTNVHLNFEILSYDADRKKIIRCRNINTFTRHSDTQLFLVTLVQKI